MLGRWVINNGPRTYGEIPGELGIVVSIQTDGYLVALQYPSTEWHCARYAIWPSVTPVHPLGIPARDYYEGLVLDE